MNSADEMGADPLRMPRIGKLDSLQSVRAELARLYRLTRRNVGDDIDAQTATKLAYLLNSIGRSLEGVELERRIAELEARMR